MSAILDSDEILIQVTEDRLDRPEDFRVDRYFVYNDLTWTSSLAKSYLR